MFAGVRGYLVGRVVRTSPWVCPVLPDWRLKWEEPFTLALSHSKTRYTLLQIMNSYKLLLDSAISLRLLECDWTASYSYSQIA